jgi:hypothetical protein
MSSSSSVNPWKGPTGALIRLVEQAKTSNDMLQLIALAGPIDVVLAALVDARHEETAYKVISMYVETMIKLWPTNVSTLLAYSYEDALRLLGSSVDSARLLLRMYAIVYDPNARTNPAAQGMYRALKPHVEQATTLNQDWQQWRNAILQQYNANQSVIAAE